MTLTWYRHFQRNGELNQILRRQISRFHYGSKVPAVTITAFITILEQKMKSLPNLEVQKTKDTMSAFVWLFSMFNYLLHMIGQSQDEWKFTCTWHDPIWDVVRCQCITKTTNKHLPIILIRLIWWRSSMN